MNLIKINNNWDKKSLGIALSIGNICNYKCWYCFPGANEGDKKWPDLGEISGTCGQILFNELENCNLRDNDFIEKFNPYIQPSICNQTCCNCMAETNLSKQKLKKDV